MIKILSAIGAILSFILAAYIAVCEENFWIVFLFVFLSIFFSILALHERIKLVNILKGIIETRELKASLKDLRHVIEASTRAILELVQTQMRFGGVPYEEKEGIYNNLTKVLESAEFTPAEIAQIQTRWHYWVEGDYVRAIIAINNINHPAVPKEKVEEWHKKREDLKFQINVLQPDDLRKIFQDFGAFTDEIKSLIDDFEYYKKNKQHRDVEKWKKLRS